MAHLRETVMAAVTTVLTGLTTTDTNVTRGRVYNIDTDEMPHLCIWQGDEDPLVPDGEDEATYIYQYFDLNVFIDAYVKASSGVLETTLNQIQLEVHNALMADVKLGLSQVIDTIESSTAQPELSGENEKRLGMMRMNYIIRYRRQRTNPEA